MESACCKDDKDVKYKNPTKKIPQTKINFTVFEDNFLTIENIDYVKSIIIELEINYNYITNIEINEDKEDNKYIQYSSIITLLQNENILNSDIIKSIAINILLDDLDFDKTILLVNYLLNNGYNLTGLTNFEKDILLYYNNNLITSSNGKLHVLFIPKKSDFGKYTLYIITKSKVQHISGSNILLVSLL